LVTEHYATGVKVADEEMDALNLQRHDVCPQWNYTIRPRTNPSSLSERRRGVLRENEVS